MQQNDHGGCLNNPHSMGEPHTIVQMAFVFDFDLKTALHGTRLLINNPKPKIFPPLGIFKVNWIGFACRFKLPCPRLGQDTDRRRSAMGFLASKWRPDAAPERTCPT